MDRLLIVLKKENGPRASSAPALGLNTIIFKHIFWYICNRSQVSVYRTIGPLFFFFFFFFFFFLRVAKVGEVVTFIMFTLHVF